MIELTEGEKTILWATETLAELARLGLVNGGTHITSKGISAFDQLKASGWEPDPDHLKQCYSHLCGYDKTVVEAIMVMGDGLRNGKMDSFLENYGTEKEDV